MPTQLPPHCSIISSLLSKVTGAWIPQKLGGLGGWRGRGGKGNGGEVIQIVLERMPRRRRSSTQLPVTQQSSASITVQCCSEPLLPGGPGTSQFKQTLPAWVQCHAQVTEHSWAVWGVQRKGTAVKSDLLGFTSSSPVLPLSAWMFATPSLRRPFENGAGGSGSDCK